MSTEDILAEREKTHGSFPVQAIHSQGIKSMLAKPGLDPVLAEGLELIAVKLSRIICGNPEEPDHWADIAGYARLVANYLERVNEVQEPPLHFRFARVNHRSTDCSECGAPEGENHSPTCPTQHVEQAPLVMR